MPQEPRETAPPRSSESLRASRVPRASDQSPGSSPSGSPIIGSDPEGLGSREGEERARYSLRKAPRACCSRREAKAAGFRAFVITNQSGIGRGLITEAQYHAVQDELLRQIGAGVIDATYFCADPPAAPSTRRKPEPGMVLEAAAAYDIDLARSYFIGDKSADIECGQRAGTRTILVLTGYGAEQDCRPDFTAHDMAEAVEIVLTASAAPASARESPRISGSRP